jgi:hypothetical protein
VICSISRVRKRHPVASTVSAKRSVPMLQNAPFLPTPSQSRPNTPSAFGGIQISQNRTQNGPLLMPADDWIPQTQYSVAGTHNWPGSQGNLGEGEIRPMDVAFSSI